MKVKSTKNILDYLKKTNVKRFVLFFVLTFVFLIFSKLSATYKQTLKLKVVLNNLNEEVVLKNDSLNTIDAFVEANGFALLPYQFKDFVTVTVDSKVDAIQTSNDFVFDTQRHKFLIEEQLGNSYKLISIKPDTLRLQYSKMASKYVPIQLKTDINYAIGYDLKEQFVLSVDSVKLVGSASKLDSIFAINTELLELKHIKSEINQTLNLNIDELSNVEIFPKEINVKGEVVRFTEGTLDIPITVVNKPNNIDINFFPKTVTLSYYVDLERYKTIIPEDFKVECDYKKIKNSQSYLKPELVKKPEFVKRAQIKQKRIEFIKL